MSVVRSPGWKLKGPEQKTIQNDWYAAAYRYFRTSEAGRRQCEAYSRTATQALRDRGLEHHEVTIHQVASAFAMELVQQLSSVAGPDRAVVAAGGLNAKLAAGQFRLCRYCYGPFLSSRGRKATCGSPACKRQSPAARQIRRRLTGSDSGRKRMERVVAKVPPPNLREVDREITAAILAAGSPDERRRWLPRKHVQYALRDARYRGDLIEFFRRNELTPLEMQFRAALKKGKLR